MDRQSILRTIKTYRQKLLPMFPPTLAGARELGILDRFQAFINDTPHCLQPHHFEPGHLTGSALVVSADFERVVLTLHRKLGIWLQLGGHADGHALLHEVALREAREESGLTMFSIPRFFSDLAEDTGIAAAPSPSADTALPLPFDFDIHEIPAHRDKPAHLHFDVRYLLIAHDHELIRSEESLDLRWFTWDEARRVTGEASMHRQFDKLLYWKALSQQATFAVHSASRQLDRP